MKNPDNCPGVSNSIFDRWMSRCWSFLSLFPEFDHAYMVSDPDGVLRAWRERALKILVFVAFFANLPLIFTTVSGKFEVIPAWAANTVLLLFLPFLVLSMIEKIAYNKRVCLLLFAKLLIGLVQITTTQLVGSGRISLLTVPIVALILSGEKLAVIFAFLGFAIFATVAGLVYSGSMLIVAVNQEMVTGNYWIFQVLVWLGGLIPHLYLMGHFFLLQRKTLAAIATAHEKVEEAVAKNHQLEFEMNQVGEEERRKLGAELHDGLCQHLAATLLNFSALEIQLKNSNFEDLPFFDSIKSKVEQSIDMAYEVSRGLYPVRFEFDALVPALQELCREKRLQSKIDCRLVSEEDVEIENKEVAIQLYRIAGEAITNAIKHSGCSQIIVRLFESNEDIFLETEDDGNGLDSERKNSNGRGLNIMKYRASLIGGCLEIVNSESGGLIVRCRISKHRIGRS